MLRFLGAAALCIFGLISSITIERSADAQTSLSAAGPMITRPIIEANLVRLLGNTRREANAANDRGRVADNFPMEHMFLQLRRPAAQEQALAQYIDQLHDPASANFQRWLTPDQVGAQFGLAPSDIQKISGWLQQHGFYVNVIYPSGMTIDFSGTAGQVLAAFHTEIHYLQVNGHGHAANMSDPQIPAALTPAVVGIVSLHDFKPRTEYTSPPNSSGAIYLVTPADLAMIYNFPNNPLALAQYR
jgi:subtilase family serine protease